MSQCRDLSHWDMPSPPQPTPASSSRPPSLLALPSYLAGSVARIGHRALAARLQEHGLRLPQYAVLAALADFGSLAPHELAHRLQADRSHVSGYVDVLVRNGLAARERDPDDRRRLTVTLTPAGRALFGSLSDAAAASQQGMLRDLSPEEQHTLVSLLAKVITTADAASPARARPSP